MSCRLRFGAFADERDLLDAARECHDKGMSVRDVYSPYPVHGLDPLLGIKRTRLPFVTLVAGAIGLALAFWSQYWTSAHNWPLNVGGKPYDSFPAFVPVAFELTVLFGGLATAFFLLARSGLFPGSKRQPVHAKVTDDRFVLVLEHKDASFSEEDYESFWHRHGALETWSEVC
ncbi:MAG: iron ABC transporter [Planctomycetes bacterium]|jgi:hypothetical protein|nr:iron ABC transporter [Planctomycetota bacterium]